MARIRSPNYPTIGLAIAIEKARAVLKTEGKNAVAREAIAKALGFGSLNGASATMLSALSKYGLLENVGEGESKTALVKEKEEKEGERMVVESVTLERRSEKRKEPQTHS